MHAFILAGGFATRLWPLTEKRAKPLLPIAQVPLISTIVKRIQADTPITVSTNAAFAQDFTAWKSKLSRPVTITIEDAGGEHQKLGALGAIARWIEAENITDDILLLAGDNYMECDFNHICQTFRGNPLVIGVDIGSLEAAKAFGTIILSEQGSVLQRVTSFEEKPMAPRSTIVSTGVWILPASGLRIVKEFAALHPDNVGGIFEEFLRRNVHVDCLQTTGRWKDIGSYEAYLDLDKEIIGDAVMKGKNVTILESTLEGTIDIGNDVVIKNSQLRDCIFFGSTVVRDCNLERCVIDTGCTLEGVDLQDKMLRQDTVLVRR